MHDVGINLVAARGQRRELHCEFTVADLVRMQVPEAFHVRHAHQKQMQQVTVIRNEIIEAQKIRNLHVKTFEALNGSGLKHAFKGIGVVQPQP